MRPALFNILTARVPEADLLIDTMTVRPQGNRAFLISDTIRRLKAADIWAKLDVLWMLAAHDAQAGRLNWKAPASFALTAVNSPTFTADRGYAGDGSTSYLDTGWNPTSFAGQYALNNASQFVWVQNNGSLTGAHMGSTSNGMAFINNTNSEFIWRHSQASNSGIGAAVTNGYGFFSTERTGSAASEAFLNGASVTTSAIARDRSLPNDTLTIGKAGASHSNRIVAAVGFGASLGGASHAALYRIVQPYVRAVGAET